MADLVPDLVATVRVWVARIEAAHLRHPIRARRPADFPDGVLVPLDQFTARRISDGDWRPEQHRIIGMAFNLRRFIGELIQIRDDGALAMAPAADQDPILDHAAGTKTSVTLSAEIFTPPAGCKFVRIRSDVDALVRTDGQDVTNTAAPTTNIPITLTGGQPEIIPVTPNVKLKAMSVSGSAVITVVPLKARS